MSSDLVKRLRDTPNWLRQDYGHHKGAMSHYDRAPFEAADRIEALEAEVARLRAAMEWQPIAKMPDEYRNGRDMLLRFDGGGGYIVAAWRKGAWDDGDWNHAMDEEEFDAYMLLPAAPKGEV
jgi:hypothetical protein